MTREQDKDSEFEAYLQGKSALSDAYADVPQPRLPDHLDAAILAEAHRAVNARPGGERKRSWVFPVSMAATLFVAVIIGAQLRYLLPSAESPQMARNDMAAGGKPEKEIAGKENVVAQDKVAAAPVPAPVQAEQKAARETQRRAVVAPAPAAPAARNEESAASGEAAPAPAAAAAANKPMAADQAAPAALAEKQEAMPGERAAPGGESRMMAKKKMRTEGEPAAFAARSSAPMAALSAAQVMVQPASAPAASADTSNLRPEEWIVRIRQLKQQGKLEEARKELAAFKKRYPAYVVPKDIELR